MDTDPGSSTVGRRSLLLGGAGVAFAATALAGLETAAAAPPRGVGTAGVAGVAGGARRPRVAVIPASIGSPPISQYTYRSVDMYDFDPFDAGAGRTWGGFGVYSSTVASVMRASVEIPAGVLLRDVEYYVYNNSGTSVAVDTYVYVPGNGYIYSLSIQPTVPSTGAIVAARGVAPAGSGGPFPVGARLLLSVTTPNNGNVQVNGARVGFQRGAADLGLLRVPVRAYDSRHTSKFKAGQTRVVTLPAAAFTRGQAGVTVTVVALGASAAGTVKVWAADGSEPAGSAVYYDAGGHAVANTITTGVSSLGQLRIKCSSAAHVVLDVSATIA